MRGFLLDTSIALIATAEPERLSKQAKNAITRGPAYLSVVAYWEVMIKAMKGTLDVGDPRRWYDQTIIALGLRPLLWRPEHVDAVFALQPIHQDPFDRALIAQATAEDLTLITTDATIQKYASGGFRVIG